MCKLSHIRGDLRKKEVKHVEIKKLEKIMEKIPNEKMDEANLIVAELKFILETIEELKKAIKDKGAVEHFVNGKQDFLRESPALGSYNKLMKTYDVFYKNLINLVPKEELPEVDEFDSDNL